MDPITAGIIGGVVAGPFGAAIGYGMANQYQMQKEQKRLREEQERLRIESVRAEMGAANQKTNLALGTAAKRPTSGLSPSFAAAALTGNESSNTQALGSSGTF